MMNAQFVKSAEKKRMIEELNEKFGITEIPWLLIEAGKEKTRGFSGHLSKEEIIELGRTINIETIGLYVIKKEHDLRLSLDAPILLRSQISKGIIEINDLQFNDWIRGRDLQFKIPQGTYIVKYKNDFIGCGRSNGEILFNYVPKDRRVRK